MNDQPQLPIDPEIKTEWLQALRSGEYRQGISRLTTNYSDHSEYCCLGVLCDVLVKKGLAQWEYDTEIKFGNDEDTTVLMPPPNLRKFVGITEEECKKLARLNDDVGSSFLEIARYIEQNL